MIKMINKWIPLIGFIILVVMTTTLLVSATYEAWQFHFGTGIITFLITVGVVSTMIYEGKRLNKIDPTPEEFLHQFFNFFAVFAGGVSTFYLSTRFGLGAVVASCLVGMLVAMIFPKYGVPAYCGAFVGMSSDGLFYTMGDVALAGVIAGLAFVLTSKVFNGFGGKLGTIAFIGTSGAGITLGRIFLVGQVPDLQTSAWIMLIAFIAAPLTFYLNCYKKQGPVLASGMVGILGGLVLPVIFPEIGQMLAVVAVCASYTGMTSEGRCPAFWEMLIAGLITGNLFIFALPLLGGAGGKLGTIGFASIMAIWGYIHLFEDLYTKESRYQPDQDCC